MELGFCGNPGKESGETGAPLDVPLQVCMFGKAHDIPEGLRPVSSPLDNRRSRKSMQLPLVLQPPLPLRCGGTISSAQTVCLNPANCRLWAEQSWGTTDAPKIAPTLDKFRGAAQVTSIFRLHHFLSENAGAEPTEGPPHHTLYSTK